MPCIALLGGNVRGGMDGRREFPWQEARRHRADTTAPVRLRQPAWIAAAARPPDGADAFLGLAALRPEQSAESERILRHEQIVEENVRGRTGRALHRDRAQVLIGVQIAVAGEA